MTDTATADETNTPTVNSAAECQQCGTITTTDFQNCLPSRCGFCGAGSENLIEL